MEKWNVWNATCGHWCFTESRETRAEAEREAVLENARGGDTYEARVMTPEEQARQLREDRP